MQNAYAYVQPSIIEGLSPVILTVMGLGTPLICSDIVENIFITKENAVHFVSGNADSLNEKLRFALDNENKLRENVGKGQADVSERFNWDTITDQYIALLKK
jgi:glycosyltransferase involved in cell wall biosynthesis